VLYFVYIDACVGSERYPREESDNRPTCLEERNLIAAYLGLRPPQPVSVEGETARLRSLTPSVTRLNLGSTAPLPSLASSRSCDSCVWLYCPGGGSGFHRANCLYMRKGTQLALEMNGRSIREGPLILRG
jgi:hypothetical protein